MNCYCVSGLGADKRVFKNLALKHSLIYLEWIEPRKNESLAGYSKRLSAQIDTSEPFILLGVSFGGLVACHIAEILKPHKTIVISTITDKAELNLFLRFLSRLNLHRFIPARLFKPPLFLAKWLFGIKTLENGQLLRQILKDTDLVFTKWAISKIVSSEKIPVSENILRIHGTLDRLLPLKKGKTSFKIVDGGHFMIIENAEEISWLINEKT